MTPTAPHSGTVKVNGIDLYYEIHGSGEPLLMIEGLGYSAWMWYKQIPIFSKRYQVILFDNRGKHRQADSVLIKNADDPQGLGDADLTGCPRILKFMRELALTRPREEPFSRID
jgi:pimeloyl-ACP methyl ester carboxylesterase